MKAIIITLSILIGSAQLAFAGGHCNTAIANEQTDTVYLSHETKKPISHQACMKNLTNALSLAAKLCNSKKLPNKSIATVSATYYSQSGELTELISEGFYNCTHKVAKRNIASTRKSKLARKIGTKTSKRKSRGSL